MSFCSQGGGVLPDRHTFPLLDRVPSRGQRPPTYSKERAVSILLEYILVEHSSMITYQSPSRCLWSPFFRHLVSFQGSDIFHLFRCLHKFSSDFSAELCSETLANTSYTSEPLCLKMAVKDHVKIHNKNVNRNETPEKECLHAPCSVSRILFRQDN